jgi:ADP-glucose pyrophosphorylase
VDFPLSNCVNSNIDTVGIATQYQPQKLNEYIGNGQPWDLDRLYGGVHTLPPYEQAKGTDWYKGTANAIYQNISFIDSYDPESSSCPATRSASRITPTSSASTRRRAQSSLWPSWKLTGRKLPVSA